MEKIGELFQDDRDIYLVVESEGDAYIFDYGMFHIALTKYARKGMKIKDIEALMKKMEEPGT